MCKNFEVLLRHFPTNIKDAKAPIPPPTFPWSRLQGREGHQSKPTSSNVVHYANLPIALNKCVLFSAMHASENAAYSTHLLWKIAGYSSQLIFPSIQKITLQPFFFKLIWILILNLTPVSVCMSCHITSFSVNCLWVSVCVYGYILRCCFSLPKRINPTQAPPQVCRWKWMASITGLQTDFEIQHDYHNSGFLLPESLLFLLGGALPQ